MKITIEFILVFYPPVQFSTRWRSCFECCLRFFVFFVHVVELLIFAVLLKGLCYVDVANKRMYENSQLCIRFEDLSIDSSF